MPSKKISLIHERNEHISCLIFLSIFGDSKREIQLRKILLAQKRLSCART